MSKFEKAMRTALGYQKAFNKQDIPGMMEFISDDCSFESANPAPDGVLYSGKVEISGYWRDYFGKRKQLYVEIEEVFSIGDHCVLRWKSTWVGAESKMKALRGVDIIRVGGGGIEQIFSYIKGNSG
jgi:ketosteroid isomerase-like protein